MIECKICNKQLNSLKSLSSHIRGAHKITSKDYYDTYMKKENEGICPVCGKETKYRNINKGYRKYCSNYCSSRDPEFKKKVEETHLKRYGVRHAFQLQKTIDNSHTEEANERRKQSLYDHYGVTTTFKSTEIQEKIKQTNLERYGTENAASSDIIKNKIKQTNNERYGVDWITQSDEIKEKMKQTWIDHYGVENPFQAEEIKEKCKQAHLSNLGVENPAQSMTVRQNQIDTLRKNGKMSKLEQYLENKLNSLDITYIREYKDARYPYFCDFYLPDSDTFVELNGFWMHNGHWFNDNNLDDIHILNIWKEKATTNTIYTIAIDVWTKHDLEKRDIAIQNNLNYIVLWNKQDIDEYIKQLRAI